MQANKSASGPVRFGVFDVDLHAGELRKNGVKIKLQRQPFAVLAMLIERGGELVTREELRKQLWPDETFVDFDHSVNKAVSAVRAALADSPQSPRFIETLPGRGYRFIAPVEPAERRSERTSHPRRRWVVALAVGALLAVLLGLNAGGFRDRLLDRPNVGEVSSLAVLPLDNLSADPDQEYFADGVTEALITELGQLSALRVISRRSVMQYKNSDKTVSHIGQELHVDAVVEGSVAREGDRIRITAQLLRVAPEEHLWAKSYDSALTDVLELQSEVARTIAKEIQVAVTPDEEARLTHKRQVDPQAHEAYLRGRYFFNRYSPDGIRKGIEHTHRALEIDPDYAAAWAALCPVYGSLGYWGFRRPRDVMSKAKAAALRAVELDDTLADGHCYLGAAKQYVDWDWAGGEEELRRALELNPNHTDARLNYALLLGSLGRLEESMAQIRRGREVNPLSPVLSAVIGWVFYASGQYAQAIEQLRHTLEMDANFPIARWFLWRAHRQQGSDDAALEECKQMFALQRNHEVAQTLQQGYSQSGYNSAMRAAGERLAQDSTRGYIPPTDVAMLFAHAGEKDLSIEWLEKGYEERDPRMHFIFIDPDWDLLRSDPRYRDLLRRMNFPQ